MEIKVLVRRGRSIKADCAGTGGIQEHGVQVFTGRGKAEVLAPVNEVDPFVAYLQGRVDAAKPDWIPATVLVREIRECGYAGGISQLKVLLASL